MGNFLCGVEMVKPYVNAHLDCIVSSLKWASKMLILPINGKISVNTYAYACVVYVCNVTSALYCAVNNHFCVIRLSFVATTPFNAHQNPYIGRRFFGYNSPAAAAREVFKPSTDSASLVVPSQKKNFQFWVWGSLGGA